MEDHFSVMHEKCQPAQKKQKENQRIFKMNENRKKFITETTNR